MELRFLFGGEVFDLLQVFVGVLEEIFFAVGTAELDLLALIDKYRGRAHLAQFIVRYRAGGERVRDDDRGLVGGGVRPQR